MSHHINCCISLYKVTIESQINNAKEEDKLDCQRSSNALTGTKIPQVPTINKAGRNTAPAYTDTHSHVDRHSISTPSLSLYMYLSNNANNDKDSTNAAITEIIQSKYPALTFVTYKFSNSLIH